MLLKNNIFTIKNSYIEIIPLADLHLGAQGCNERLIRQAVTYIANNKYCYAVGLGDWIDLVTYHSKGLVGEQKFKATEQYSRIIDILNPIKHKILFALSGNHCARATKCGTPDVMFQIADKLGIEYRGLDCYFAVKLPKGLVYIYAAHNSGGGATPGSKINRLHNLHNQAPFSDIVLSAHTHHFADDIKPIPFLTPYGKLTSKLQYLISCGSALESTEGYAKAAFFPPQATCFKILKISIKRGTDGCDQIRVDKTAIMGSH